MASGLYCRLHSSSLSPWGCQWLPWPNVAAMASVPAAMALANSPTMAVHVTAVYLTRTVAPPLTATVRTEAASSNRWVCVTRPRPAAAKGNERVATALANSRMMASPVIAGSCKFPAHVVKETRPIAFVGARTYSVSTLRESVLGPHPAAARVSGPVATVWWNSAITARRVIAD